MWQTELFILPDDVIIFNDWSSKQHIRQIWSITLSHVLLLLLLLLFPSYKMYWTFDTSQPCWRCSNRSRACSYVMRRLEFLCSVCPWQIAWWFVCKICWNKCKWSNRCGRLLSSLSCCWGRSACYDLYYFFLFRCNRLHRTKRAMLIFDWAMKTFSVSYTSVYHTNSRHAVPCIFELQIFQRLIWWILVHYTQNGVTGDLRTLQISQMDTCHP